MDGIAALLVAGIIAGQIYVDLKEAKPSKQKIEKFTLHAYRRVLLLGTVGILLSIFLFAYGQSTRNSTLFIIGLVGLIMCPVPFVYIFLERMNRKYTEK